MFLKFMAALMIILILYCRYERHLSWQRLLVQQMQKNQREGEPPPGESPMQTEPSGNSTATSSVSNQESSSSSDRIEGSESGDLESNTRTDAQNNSQYDIPSTSGVGQHPKGPSPEGPRTEHEGVKADSDGEAMAAGDTEEGRNTKHVKQREWMREGFEISDLSNSSAMETLHTNNDDDDNCGDVNRDGSTSKVCSKDNTPESEEESGEEFIIVSGDEGETSNRDWKACKVEAEKSEKVHKKSVKKVVKKSDPFKIYEYLQLSFEEVICFCRLFCI